MTTEDWRTETESTAVTEASPLTDTRWPRHFSHVIKLAVGHTQTQGSLSYLAV